MIRLRFDFHRHLYVNEDFTKGIALSHTYFADVQERFDGHLEGLEEKVFVCAAKKFAKDRRKPDAYSVTDLGSFFVVEFLYVTAPYQDLSLKAAK
jgi:hypothetical protein